MRKRVLPILLVLAMSLSACIISSADQIVNTGKTAGLTLYAVFFSSTEEKQITLPIEGESVSRSFIAFALADGLSEWTGLDFKLNDIAFPDEESVLVDWSKDSTLISGIGDRAFKEDFHFYDAVSLNWFMMDSLWRTLNEAFHKDVYYTMDGGKELKFEELSPINIFPATVPYMGSPFYFAHDDGRGDMKN